MTRLVLVALAASVAAVGTGIADVAKALAAHPAVQEDDTGTLQGFVDTLNASATQLEGMAADLNAPAAGDGTGDNSGASSGNDAGTGDATGTAPEAGSEEGPGTAEQTPQTVDEGDAEQAAS